MRKCGRDSACGGRAAAAAAIAQRAEAAGEGQRRASNVMRHKRSNDGREETRSHKAGEPGRVVVVVISLSLSLADSLTRPLNTWIVAVVGAHKKSPLMSRPWNCSIATASHGSSWPRAWPWTIMILTGCQPRLAFILRPVTGLYRVVKLG